MVIKRVSFLLVCSALLHLASADEAIGGRTCVTIKQEGSMDKDEYYTELTEASLNSGVKSVTVSLMNPPRLGVKIAGMSVLLCDPYEVSVENWNFDSDEITITRTDKNTLPKIHVTVRSFLEPIYGPNP